MRSKRGFVDSNTLLVIVVLFALAAIFGLSILTWQTVEGDEVGVRETWGAGVDPVSLAPKTYWRWRWTEDIYTYKISGQVFVMNDKPNSTYGEGRTVDVLEVKSLDNQKIHFNVTVRWHRDSIHVVELHKAYRDSVEERLLRPEVVNSMTTHATVKDAISLYSGIGRNDLRNAVEAQLRDVEGALRKNGVIVDAFIIDDVNFPNKEYVDAIENRQLQIVKKSRAEEEQKANQAIADAARIAALKQQYEAVVAAQTAKQTQILAQEAESEKAIIEAKANATNTVVKQKAQSEQIVLQAEADAKKQVALSESAKQADLNRAIAIEAVGKAEAEKNRLLLASYAVPGSDLYTKVKVAEQFATAMNTVRFYPANATFNTIAENFDKGLSLLVSGQGAQAPTTK